MLCFEERQNSHHTGCRYTRRASKSEPVFLFARTPGSKEETLTLVMWLHIMSVKTFSEYLDILWNVIEGVH